MYVQFPTLSTDEQLIALNPIKVDLCCRAPVRAQDAALYVDSYVVESAAARPLMRFTLINGERLNLDLTTGKLKEDWSVDSLAEIGSNFAALQQWQPPETSEWLDLDQWTVQGNFNAHRPLLKFSNSSGQEWYVSSQAARVVQATDRQERFWNWVGAVTHWIYPTVIRQHTSTWAQTVIWLTIIGLFLTVTGVAVGLKNYRWRSSKRGSPYRGWTLWHHYSGLIFGLMTLVWLFSGLLSMNPWGTLEGRSVASERIRLNGTQQSLGEVVTTLRSILPHIPAETVRLSSTYWLGEPFVLASDKHGKAIRLTSAGQVAGLTRSDIADAATVLSAKPAKLELLEAADDYYFGLHTSVELPVYRIHTAANERYYLSALSGQLLAHFDDSRRWYRWLFEGLHRGDFHHLIRQRPAWDLVMLLLLAGVTIGAATGVYLGWRRIRPAR